MLTSFLVAVATSTVLATLLNQGIVQFREWRERKEAGRLSAIHAVMALVDYCDQCATRRGEKDNHLSSDGHAGTDWGSLPELPPYSEQIDWKRLGLAFTERMFAFRAGISSSQSLISSHYEFDPPEGGDAPLFAALTAKGVEAMKLARDISSEYRLTLLVTERAYSSEDYLIASEQRRVAEYEERVARVAQTLPAVRRD